MSQPQSAFCRRSVDRAYEPVAKLLREQPAALLLRATAPASARPASTPSLRVDVAGFQIGVDVQLLACKAHELSAATPGGPALKLELAWTSQRSPALFPSMLAELSARPRDSGADLELRAAYWPPFGPVGVAIDAAVGHRVAEACIQRLLEDLVAQLRHDVPDSPTAGSP
jgi:hypothetical protein